MHDITNVLLKVFSKNRGKQYIRLLSKLSMHLSNLGLKIKV